jgi:hypothetical protein
MNGQGPAMTTARKNTPLDFGTDGMRMLDDLLRKRLKVGNPSDVGEMLKALQGLYPEKSAAIVAEGLGLPPTTALALPTTTIPANSQAARSFASAEYDLVLTEMQNDFTVVVNAAENRDYNVELTGWQSSSAREYAEGAAAARLAQDPGQRERALLAIRRLNEYAFAIRFFATTTGESFWDFRRVATTLDNAADNLRILIGETLYDVGLALNGLLLQVPVADFRTRGTSLIDSLEGWLSGDQEIFDDWGVRLTSYQAFFDHLEPDLRVYARPEGLRAAIDGLVNAVVNGMSSNSADALRQLAITAPPEIGRLTRVFAVAKTVLSHPTSASSSLSIFVRSLGLFIDAFKNARGGVLYIDLALPSPLSGRKLSPALMPQRLALRAAVDYRSLVAEVNEADLAYEPRTAPEAFHILLGDVLLLNLHLAVDKLANA